MDVAMLPSEDRNEKADPNCPFVVDFDNDSRP